MERHYLTCTKMVYKMIKKYIKLISFHFAINYTLKSIYIFFILYDNTIGKGLYIFKNIKFTWIH